MISYKCSQLDCIIIRSSLFCSLTPVSIHESCFLTGLSPQQTQTPLSSTHDITCVLVHCINDPYCFSPHLDWQTGSSTGKSLISIKLLLSLGEEKVEEATHNSPKSATRVDASIQQQGCLGIWQCKLKMRMFLCVLLCILPVSTCLLVLMQLCSSFSVDARPTLVFLPVFSANLVLSVFSASK